MHSSAIFTNYLFPILHRYHNHIPNVLGGSGGGGSGGDNNSITTGTGSVISSSIGATGSEGSSTPIASPPSSIHGSGGSSMAVPHHPLSGAGKTVSPLSPSFLMHSSSSSATSAGGGGGPSSRRRNNEPPPSEISV